MVKTKSRAAVAELKPPLAHHACQCLTSHLSALEPLERPQRTEVKRRGIIQSPPLKRRFVSSISPHPTKKERGPLPSFLIRPRDTRKGLESAQVFNAFSSPLLSDYG